MSTPIIKKRDCFLLMDCLTALKEISCDVRYAAFENVESLLARLNSKNINLKCVIEKQKETITHEGIHDSLIAVGFSDKELSNNTFSHYKSCLNHGVPIMMIKSIKAPCDFIKFEIVNGSANGYFSYGCFKSLDRECCPPDIRRQYCESRQLGENLSNLANRIFVQFKNTREYMDLLDDGNQHLMLPLYSIESFFDF